MTYRNILGNSFTGTTGSGKFVGSISPELLGDVDCSGASFFRLPVSSNPTLNITGQMALDDTVSGYPGLLHYYDGSQKMAMLGIAAADFSATDNYQISYSNAFAKLLMSQQASGKLVNYNISTSTTNDSTTSVSFVSSSLSGSITPRSTSNTIYVIVSCYANVAVSSGSQTEINFYMRLRRTSGSATTLFQSRMGKTNLTANTSSHSYRNVQLLGAETAPATTAQTYELQFGQLANTNLTCNIAGSTYTAIMIILEVAP